VSYFLEPAVDLVAEAMAKDPVFEDRYQAIADMRELDRQVGGLYRGSEWKRVANLQGPILDLAKVLDPEWLSDRRRFYAFLDAHPEVCMYDRRKNAVPNQLTMSDGKVIL
jgi:hypothetical protein